MTDCCFEDVDFLGEHGVRMTSGGYEALVIPGIGANLIQLKYKPQDLDLLRIPADVENLKNMRNFYGMPILFPPNRIEGGKFKLYGREYNFPLNSLDGRHYIHGCLRLMPWNIKKKEFLQDSALEIELSLSVGKNDEFYQYFPHEFECSMIYRLSKDGLLQEINVTNKSHMPMPLGIGFHTAIKVPFSYDGKTEDYSMRISVGKRWELNEYTVPTGKLNDLNDSQRMLRDEGIKPLGKKFVSEHYTMETMDVDGREFNGVVITDTVKRVRLMYEVDNQYKHWVIWNDNADKGYICPEPQSWVINAPNVNLPEEISGFRLLEPGEAWSGHSRLYIETV